MKLTSHDLVTELRNLEKQAGEEGWGGEFREDLFDVFVHYFEYQHLKKHPTSVSGLLKTLVDMASAWMTKGNNSK